LLTLSFLPACKSKKPVAIDASVPHRNAVLTVRVSPEKRSGEAWDNYEVYRAPEGPGPDIAACIVEDGKRKCYPGDVGDISAVRGDCRNETECAVWSPSVPVSGRFRFEIWDLDGFGGDWICGGECSFGETCIIEPDYKNAACAVAVLDNPIKLNSVTLHCPAQATGICPEPKPR
jgi:hypothetical protein